MARRFNRKPLTDERARRAPQGRPRPHRAGRPRAADHRRLAALDQRPRQQRPLQVLQPRKPDADRDRLLRRAASPRPTSPASAPSCDSTAACARARRRSASSPPSPSRTATTTARRPARSASSSAPCRSSTSRMTDPLPGKEPVPLAPPAEPITGDSHHHLIAPLIAHAAQLGYTRRDPRPARATGPAAGATPSAADRHRHRTRQPAGPHARSTRSPTPTASATSSTAASAAEVLVDCVTYCVLRLGRPRRRRRVDPLRM